ncbi:MAG TPA: diguanylate cyclase [Desulfurobacteriaceae bacterium]|nr:diguanylate cyclase [Desulfurobacteriaceae bacterium]
MPNSFWKKIKLEKKPIKSLKNKIFVTFFIFFLTVFIFALFTLSEFKSILLKKELFILNEEYFNLFIGYKKNLVDTAYSLAVAIASDSKLKEAALKKNLDYIKKKYYKLNVNIQANTNYKSLKLVFILNTNPIYIYTVPTDKIMEDYLLSLKNFFFSKDKRKINNLTIIKSFILTSDDIGSLSTYPISLNKTLLGYVGVSLGLKTIENIIKDAKILFLFRRDFVSNKEFYRKYPLLKNFIVVNNDANIYINILKNIDLNKQAQIHKNKFIYVYPIYDFTGNELGKILIIKDISNILYDLNTTLGYVTLLMVILFVLGIIISNVGLYYIVTKPVGKIIEKFENIKREYIKCLDLKTYERSNDELTKLTIIVDSLIYVLNNMQELDKFRKAIETDETLDDVLNRIRNLIEKKFRFNKYAFYILNEEDQKLHLKFLKGEQPFCPELDNADPKKCRAVKTNSIIISYKEFPNLCKLFCCYDKYHHICIPIFLSGKLFGLIQLIADITEDIGHLEKRINLLIKYLQAAIPVIEAKLLMKKFHDKMIKDPLTGCYNRIFLHEFVENQIPVMKKYSIPLGILIIDIDDFKKVNDTYGHDIGDIVLKNIAEVIKKSVNKSDFVTRYGGEEFLVLLCNCQENKVDEVAERIRKNVEKLNIVTPVGILKKTVSIGASVFPVDSKDFWQCVKYADIALYKAKITGKNKVVRFKKEFLKEENEENNKE